MNFIELCLAQQASPDDIDDYIDSWHMKSDSPDLNLADYLGLTHDEYVLFAELPASLETILHARKHGRKLRFDKDY